MKIISHIIKKLARIILSNEQYARYLGVKIGGGNLIADKNHWPSEPYLVTIGNHCQLTSGVKIFTHGGAMVARVKYPKFDVFGKVVIGDRVYIGTNSLIMPGVKIGNSSMVAAGSVVTKSVPPNMVVGGNPARILCTVDEYIERNKTFDLESKGLSYEQKRTFLLSLPKERFIRKKEMV